MSASFLGCGRTTGGDNLPVSVGSDGELDGSAADPLPSENVQPMALLYGRTAAGNNVPVLCDADGKLNIVWS
jgi:hypothetical protein